MSRTVLVVHSMIFVKHSNALQLWIGCITGIWGPYMSFWEYKYTIERNMATYSILDKMDVTENAFEY